jgi:hypothetical protein
LFGKAFVVKGSLSTVDQHHLCCRLASDFKAASRFEGHHATDGIANKLYGALGALSDEVLYLVAPAFDSVTPGLVVVCWLVFQAGAGFVAVPEADQIQGIDVVLGLQGTDGMAPVLLAGTEAVNQHHRASVFLRAAL